MVNASVRKSVGRLRRRDRRGAGTRRGGASAFLPTGATRPQLSVPEPDLADRLPRRSVSGAAPDYWWLGVHGGAGETSLARLDRRTRAADHHWPMAGSGSTVVLVARSNVPGLRAAQRAATEWASGAVPEVRVAGLVVMADAPGRLPRRSATSPGSWAAACPTCGTSLDRGMAPRPRRAP
ncbi:hypothetical protein [Paenarthrobacter sp. C1]|uniref:hypothetical protein n=1 Tax=Paenarthrobacter sp. C1 TaxID=3400220 RepID=UPI003BF486AF